MFRSFIYYYFRSIFHPLVLLFYMAPPPPSRSYGPGPPPSSPPLVRSRKPTKKIFKILFCYLALTFSIFNFFKKGFRIWIQHKFLRKWCGTWNFWFFPNVGSFFNNQLERLKFGRKPIILMSFHNLIIGGWSRLTILYLKGFNTSKCTLRGFSAKGHWTHA